MIDRPAIPTKIKRDVLIEAGHRCAIPTCRQTPIELAHIVPWSETKEHTADNLIALCPTCHTRYDRGDIDRKSMYRYKANLFLITTRYCDFEIRVLQTFSDSTEMEEIKLPGGLDVMLEYLIKDGLLIEKGHVAIYFNGVPSHKIYAITSKGRDFVSRWLSGDEIS